MQKKLKRAEFLQSLRDAGFATQSECAEVLGLHKVTINGWLRKGQCPAWFDFLISAAKKARKYDELTAALQNLN